MRADLRADAAARAVVNRVIRRRLAGQTQALCLRPDSLGAGEERRRRRDGAGRCADVALQAVVCREGSQVNQGS